MNNIIISNCMLILLTSLHSSKAVAKLEQNFKGDRVKKMNSTKI